MPIEPNIAMGVRPLQLPDIAKTFGEGQQIQNMIQERQVRGQQLQEGALALQEKRKSIAAGDALTKLLSANTKVSPAGELQTDHGAVVKGLADSGYGPEALRYDAQRRADLKSALDLREQQAKFSQQKAERLGSLAGAIPKVNWTAPDASQQAVAAQSALKRAMDQALAEGLLDAPHVQGLEGQPYTPELESQVQQFGLAAMKSSEQHSAHIADLNAIHNVAMQGFAEAKDKREAELQPFAVAEAKGKPDLQAAQTNEARLKATAAQREEDATTLAAAHAQGPEAFAAAMAQLPKDRAAIFSGISDKSKADDILNLGRSPQQRMAGGNVNEWELYLRAADGDEKQALKDYQADRIAAAKAGRDPNVPAERAVARLDREVGQYGKPFDEASKNADAQLEKILEAEKLVAGGSVSQAMAIPKILQAIMSTGSSSGSGVRTTINQAEMNRVAKARGIAGDIEGFFSKAAGQGELTKDQKTQMNGLLSDIRQSITEKKQIVSDAADEMRSASSREEILAAERKGRTALAAHATKGGGAALSTGHKIGDVVNIGGKNYKITKLLPNDKFEADEVK